MANLDSTETLNTGGRAVASRLNPFIDFSDASGTAENVRMGLEFLSIAAYGLADGNSAEAMGGLSTIFRAMGAALSYEKENAGGTL